MTPFFIFLAIPLASEQCRIMTQRNIFSNFWARTTVYPKTPSPWLTNKLHFLGGQVPVRKSPSPWSILFSMQNVDIRPLATECVLLSCYQASPVFGISSVLPKDSRRNFTTSKLHPCTSFTSSRAQHHQVYSLCLSLHWHSTKSPHNLKN